MSLHKYLPKTADLGRTDPAVRLLPSGNPNQIDLLLQQFGMDRRLVEQYIAENVFEYSDKIGEVHPDSVIGLLFRDIFPAVHSDQPKFGTVQKLLLWTRKHISARKRFISIHGRDEFARVGSFMSSTQLNDLAKMSSEEYSALTFSEPQLPLVNLLKEFL